MFYGCYSYLLGQPYDTANEVKQAIYEATKKGFQTMLKQQMQQDMAIFFNLEEFADTVSYKPFDGSDPFDVAVVIADSGTSRNEYGISDTATVAIPRAAVALPMRGDSFELNGLEYTVLDRGNNDGNVWLVAAETREGRKP